MSIASKSDLDISLHHIFTHLFVLNLFFDFDFIKAPLFNKVFASLTVVYKVKCFALGSPIISNFWGERSTSMYLPLKRSFDAHTMDSVRDICPFL